MQQSLSWSSKIQQKIILEVTNLKRGRVFRERWNKLDKTHLNSHLIGDHHPAGVYKLKEKSTAGLWDADKGPSHIPSRGIRETGENQDASMSADCNQSKCLFALTPSPKFSLHAPSSSIEM